MTTTALPLQQHTAISHAGIRREEAWFEAATIQEVLGHQAPLPPRTLLLGTGEDGLPILLDLGKGSAGSMLICSDAPAAHASLIELMLRSSASSDAMFVILSRNPWRFEKMLQKNYPYPDACSGIFDTSSHGSTDQILRLSALANRRSRKNWNASPILLVVDDADLLLSAPADIARNFLWLLQSGPENQIWPVVSTHANQVASLADSGFNFSLQIIGHIADRSLSDKIAPGLHPGRFLTGRQFAAAMDQTWLPFWTPARNSL
jgi:hypothetical protein